jgi:hypothetical protein
MRAAAPFAKDLDMKTLAKEILRWAVIAASGGYGAWQLIDAGRHVIRWDGGVFGLLFMFIIDLMIAAPFLAVATICLCRQYRKLFLVLGVMGSVVVFVQLTVLPEQFGIFKIMDRCMIENPDFGFLGLPVGLLIVFVPIYGTAWFYRACHRLAYPLPAGVRRPRTQANRGLVWLGALCLVVPPTVAAIVALIHAMHSPSIPACPESIGNEYRQVIGLAVIGGLLMFLGMVNRRPLSETAEETAPPESV